MTPVPSQPKPAVSLSVAALVSLILGIAVAVALAVPVFAAVLLIKQPAPSPLLTAFWSSVCHGFFIGLGVAVGYAILNWVIGTTDRTKNSLGR